VFFGFEVATLVPAPGRSGRASDKFLNAKQVDAEDQGQDGDRDHRDDADVFEDCFVHRKEAAREGQPVLTVVQRSAVAPGFLPGACVTNSAK
jgi:hypothetical protein